MTRIRRLFLLGGALLVLPLVFAYDVVRAVVDLEVTGLRLIREVMIVGAFSAVFILIDSWRKANRRSIAKEVGRLLIASVAVTGLYLILILAGVGDRLTMPGESDGGSVLGLLWGTLAGVASGLAALWTLQTVRDIILFKRRRETRRNFLIYSGFLGATCAAASPLVPADAGFVFSILFPLTVLSTIVVSFRQNWIVYLSRREKIFTLAYSSLLFLTGLFYVVILFQTSPLTREVMEFSAPLMTFVRSIALLTTIYFGMAFVTTLFHLPTAEVFERKQSELSSLQNLTKLTTQVLDFNTLVDTVTQMTQEVCGANAVWLELTTPDGKGGWHSQIAAHRNITVDEAETVHLTTDPAVRTLLLQSRKVVLIDDTWTDRRTKGLKEHGVLRGSLVSIPLTAGEDVIGVLHASKSLEQGFDQDDVEVLTTFGDHVTIAIENAKLIARSIERERLQQEMLVARRMQQQLLPQELPLHPHFAMAAMSESSTEVGGDYYDVVPLSDTKWAVAVGDVSGKGVSAAFYMAEVKGIVQALSGVCSSPKELLVRANGALLGSLDRRAFVSLVYGVLDSRAGTFLLARAGHCPIVRVGENGGELIRPGGLGLGMAPGEVFEGATEEQLLRLREGDVVVMYTDGITEARRDDGEEFGYDRLLSAAAELRSFSAEEIKFRILETVRTFVGGGPYRDDMTLVVLKWLRADAAPGTTPDKARHTKEIQV